MNFWKQESKITNLIQIATLWALTSVFFGFLIVNIYLAFFGFWDFNFIKVQYVSAGTLFLLMAGIPGFFWYVYVRASNILDRYKDLKESRLRLVSVAAVKFCIFLILGFFGCSVFVIPVSFGNIKLTQFVLNMIGIIWVIAIWFMVRVTLKSKKDIDDINGKPLNVKNIFHYFWAHYRIGYVLIAVPFLILIFSTVAYPLIPRYFGGGKPVMVQIALNSTFDSKLIDEPNPFDAFMIYQSSDSMLLLTTSGTTYLLKQDEISYIRYLESNRLLESLKNISTQVSTSTSTSTVATSTSLSQ